MTKKQETPNFKVYNPMNYSEKPKRKKIFTQPSLAVPDQSMTMREIFDRFAKGLPISGGFMPIYDEENISNGINPKSLDLVDIQKMRIETDQKMTQLATKARNEKAQRLQQAQQNNVQEETKTT